MPDPSFANWLRKNLNHPITLLALSTLAIFVAYLIAVNGVVTGAILVGLLFGVPLLIVSLTSAKYGFLVVFIFCSFMFYAKRIVNVPLQIGLIADFFFVPMLLGIMIKKPEISLSELLKNKVALLIIIWYVFLLLEVLNPWGTFQGWVFGIRVNLRLLIITLTAIFAFDTYKFLKTFIIAWFVIAVVAALYGFYQKHVGLPGYDLRWVTEDASRLKLFFISGHWRLWSIMSGANDFGIFMVSSALFFLILSMGPFRTGYKAIMILASLFMLYTSTFSGTRTANAMFAAGMAFYIICTLDQPRSIIVLVLSGIIFLVVMFGPFDSYGIRRFRSTFRPTNDPSYLLREKNKEIIRPYIYRHPIGGGLDTSGVDGTVHAKGHPLAGWPPDSFYVKWALEAGPIGLLIILLIFSVVVIQGTINYFNVTNAKKKVLLLAFTSVFFILAIGGYSQMTIDQYPYGIIFYATIVIIDKIPKMDIEEAQST